jgi:hypothetical protein
LLRIQDARQHKTQKQKLKLNRKNKKLKKLQKTNKEIEQKM